MGKGLKFHKRISLKNNITLSAALVATTLTGYYRKSYAACSGSGGTYVCSGSNNSTQAISANVARVSTASGFSVAASSGIGVSITGGGSLSFTDVNASSITANSVTGIYGLYLRSSDYGSISVNANSVINVSGTGSYSGSRGINTINGGTGTSILNISGNVYANAVGISTSVNGYTSGGTSITTSGESKVDVSGDNSNSSSVGILVSNVGISSTTLNLSGDIYANSKGVYVVNFSTAGDVSITTNSTSKIDVSGANSVVGSIGIYAKNSVAGKSISLDLGGDIYANDLGVYALTTANNTGNSIITTQIDSNIESDNVGIFVDHQGSGAATLNLSGDITSSTGAAVYINQSTSAANITIENGATISGAQAINSKASNDVAFDVTLDGSSSAVSIIGTSGTAIQFDAGSVVDSLTITGDVTINGDVDAGGGSDSLTINSANLTIVSGSDFNNFETITLTGDVALSGNFDAGGGTSTLTLNSANLTTSSGNSFTNFATVAVNGSSSINGAMSATNFSVGSGGTLGGNNSLTGDVTISSGGTLAPGNSVGTINIIGDLNLGSGSNFSPEISSSGIDLVTVNGNVTISSASNLKVQSLGFTSGSGTILTTTGTISGTFGNVNNVGSNVSTVFASSASALSIVTLNTSSINPLLQAATNSSILFNDNLTSEIATNAFDKGKYFWIKNINRARDIEASDVNAKFSDKSQGAAFGGQFSLNQNYKLGFALANIDDKISIENNLGTKSKNSIFASIYAIYNQDLASDSKFFTSLSLGYGYHEGDNSRLVSNSGINSYANSSAKDGDLSLTLQSGLKFKKDKFYLMPIVSASYIKTSVGGFTESGGGISNVTINDYNSTTAKFREALRFGSNEGLAFVGTIISPYLELGLSQERSLGSKNISGSFYNGAQFSSKLENNNRDFITSVIGANIQVTQGVSISLSYQNSSANDEIRNEFQGGLRFKF